MKKDDDDMNYYEKEEKEYRKVKQVNTEENYDVNTTNAKPIDFYEKVNPLSSIFVLVFSIIWMGASTFATIMFISDGGFALAALMPAAFILIGVALFVGGMKNLVEWIKYKDKLRIAISYDEYTGNFYIFNRREKLIHTVNLSDITDAKCNTSYVRETDSDNNYTGRVNVVQTLYINFKDVTGAYNQYAVKSLCSAPTAADQINNIINEHHNTKDE